MVLMMSRPTKNKKTGVYQLRKRVPEELQPILGSREYKRSLGTKDPDEAKRRFPEALAACDDAFQVAYKRLKGEVRLTETDAKQLASRWFERERRRVEATADHMHWLAAGPGLDGEKEIHSLSWLENDNQATFAEFLGELIEQQLAEAGQPPPPEGSNLSVALVDAFRSHLLLLSDWCHKSFFSGLYVPSPAVMPFAPLTTEKSADETSKPDGNAKRMSDLWKAYASMKQATAADGAVSATLNEYRGIVQRFNELYDDPEVSAVNRELIADYMQQLRLTPKAGEGIRKLNAKQQIERATAEGLTCLSLPTIKKRLQCISAVLTYGEELGWLDVNPVVASRATKRLKQSISKGAGTRRRKSYHMDEMKLIFGSSLFRERRLPEGAKLGKDLGPAVYWIPLLALYTGARRNELAQLSVRDIRRLPSGDVLLNLLTEPDEDDASDGRRVKNENSRRDVPLHRDLLKLGFLEYVDSLSPDGMLFPTLKQDRYGKYGTAFGKQWGRYLKEVVRLESPVAPLHGFRHTFKTLCRGASIPRDAHERLTGHMRQSVGDDYGEWPLERLHQEMQRFPSLLVSLGLTVQRASE